jgi:hypothetical protein
VLRCGSKESHDKHTEGTCDLSGKGSVAWCSDAVRKMTRNSQHSPRPRGTCHIAQTVSQRPGTGTSAQPESKRSEPLRRRANNSPKRGLVSHGSSIEHGFAQPISAMSCAWSGRSSQRQSPPPKYLPPENQSLAEPWKTVLMITNYFSRELNTEFAAWVDRRGVDGHGGEIGTSERSSSPSAENAHSRRGAGPSFARQRTSGPPNALLNTSGNARSGWSG